MKHHAFAHRLPSCLASPLFGDRRRFGLEVRPQDPDWIAWQSDVCLRFYEGTQRRSLGGVVVDSGYRIMERIDLDGLRVLEIGPGHLSHQRYWRGRPQLYVLADIRAEMLTVSAELLGSEGIPYQTCLVQPGGGLPFGDGEFDVIVSFYSLEHLHPLAPYLDEMLRVLKSGGRLVGAIPAEGGLAWGTGRFFTSRRWLRRNSSIDPDKIICWEHPNFADFLLNSLDERMTRQWLSYWPFGLASIDFNLVIRFIHVRR
jgi:SAM-dependent methyltransferase